MVILELLATDNYLWVSVAGHLATLEHRTFETFQLQAFPNDFYFVDILPRVADLAGLAD